MRGEPRIRIAVAGFGPFPGVRKNPSAEIAQAVARSPRFRAAGLALDMAILPTAYGAGEIELRKLLDKNPDAIVLFGVAGGAKRIRVETIARNRVSLIYPDNARFVPLTRRLSASGAEFLKVRGSAARMRAAILATGANAELSTNAGSYLCNAIFYRALLETADWTPPPLTFFIHVPKPKRGRGKRPLASLIRAGEAAVRAAISEALKARSVPRRDG
jgi:pyroglutamyl-peptidase